MVNNTTIITNHHLSIETGRCNNLSREDRKCNLCEANQIDDEYHYVLECSDSVSYKKKAICKITTILETQVL